MDTHLLMACAVVAIGGLVMGSGAWPFKLMRTYKFEHWWMIGTVVGLGILPWTITLTTCPNALGAIKSAWTTNAKDILYANMFSTAWGVANVLCGLCFVRIGVALTGAILGGLGVSVGVITPLLLRSTGMGDFAKAPPLISAAGIWILCGLAIMVAGMVLAALAGFGRDRQLTTHQKTQGRFTTGLVMAAIAGVLSAGMNLAFVYGNGPIIAAMKHNGAAGLPATIPPWAIGIVGGVLVNIIFPAYLLTKNKSWGVFAASWKELLLSLVMGVNTMIAIALAGYGQILMGALGASIGFGIQQASQITGNQGLGFISGEWRGVVGTPRKQMYAAIAVLIVAATVMAYGKTRP